MPIIQTSHLSVYYEQRGEGPPCLILGGSGRDLRTKPNVLDFPLSDLFTVISYDQRGLGQTIAPPPPYRIADYADDAAALLDQLGHDSALIFGISFGGMVGQELAIRHPQRVKRLALFCTTSGGDGGSSFPLHEIADLPLDQRVQRMISLTDTRHDCDWIDANNDYLQAQIEIAEKADALRQNPTGIKDQLAARAGHDCWHRLADITCPVFIAGGTHDGIAAPPAVTKMASRLTNATLRFYDGGHLFWNTAPQSIADLRLFLADDPKFNPSQGQPAPHSN